MRWGVDGTQRGWGWTPRWNLEPGECRQSRCTGRPGPQEWWAAEGLGPLPGSRQEPDGRARCVLRCAVCEWATPGPPVPPSSAGLTQKRAHNPTGQIGFLRPTGCVISGLGTWFTCLPGTVNVTEGQPANVYPLMGRCCLPVHGSEGATSPPGLGWAVAGPMLGWVDEAILLLGSGPFPTHPGVSRALLPSTPHLQIKASP